MCSARVNLALRAVLDAELPAAATGLVVALSGGGDSASLLAALVGPGVPRLRSLPVRAVHVDHGLQPASGDFRGACESLCQRFAVPLEVLTVKVDRTQGESLEASARDARYAAIGERLAPGECVLTAHHAEDQAETVLLQLLRGAGLKGISAMPVARPLGLGWHVRPVLALGRHELRACGAAAGVIGVDDPMNADSRFDRAYLRHVVWPRVEERWPGAAMSLSRAARHFADAQELLDEAGARAVQRLRDGDALDMRALRALSAAEKRNALRHWIGLQGGSMPSSARLREALRQLECADADHLPVVVWNGHAIRRYRERVFLTPAQPPRVGQPLTWRTEPGVDLPLNGGLGTLRWSVRSGGLDRARLPPTVVVAQRAGGERLKPGPRARTQTLQHLCQSHGVLPWMRDALPLISAGGQLIAVGDLWVDADWCVAAGAPGLGCDWHDAPVLT